MSIHIKKENEGKFHRATNTPAGQKIPEAKIEAKLHSPDPKVRQEANFARNERKWNHSGHSGAVQSHISHHETHGHGKD